MMLTRMMTLMTPIQKCYSPYCADAAHQLCLVTSMCSSCHCLHVANQYFLSKMKDNGADHTT